MKLAILLSVLVACATAFEAGVGISDVTGPAGEVTMMGYAKTSQKTSGIHIRLFSRAFIFKDAAGNRAVFVSVDVGMISQIVKTAVVKQLKQKYGGLYTEQNVLLSAIHTHSGPGGFHQYMLYSIATLGFSEETFNAHVSGIVQSIEQAHNDIQPVQLLFNEGHLNGTNINRSPSSYLKNPLSERNLYPDGDTDKEMQLLKLVSPSSKKPFGSIAWYPVHCTSMNNTNLLISGDNKGWASQLMERMMEPSKLPGKNSYVAAFAQGNEGDVSPNTAGPRCLDTGEPCDILTSACGKSVKNCVAFGPGKDMEDSARIIAENQFNKAKQLMDAASYQVQETNISYVHQFVDMSNYRLTVNNQSVTTCTPSMGFSFAAGTTDGPGEFNFLQGDTEGNKLWNLLRNLLSKPSKEQMTCQHPKPILLNTGSINFPTPWQPHIVETQILRIGNIFIIGLPGEFTTMAGRRMKQTIITALKAGGVQEPIVILAGLANTYTSYITTYEEFQAQRYESASTIYGPHTLEAYQDQFKKLAAAIASKQQLTPGPEPPYLVSTAKKWSFITPIVVDSAGINKNMGDVIDQPKQSYKAGETASARFIAGHPRNDMLLGKTFLSVERKEGNNYVEVCNDACIETKFKWTRTNVVLGRSDAHISWKIPTCVKPGTYRIRHFGYWKPLFQSPKSYSGASRDFTVTSSQITSARRRLFMRKNRGFFNGELLDNVAGCGCQ